MLNTTLESQSRLIAHLLATYGGMVRNANESFAALAAMQAELAAAQARQASELWRRYFQLAQEAPRGDSRSAGRDDRRRPAGDRGGRHVTASLGRRRTAPVRDRHAPAGRAAQGGLTRPRLPGA
jgi:hypothetical protein